MTTDCILLPTSDSQNFQENMVFGNYQLLERILSFLDRTSLKIARLVCHRWGYEGGKLMKNVEISLCPCNNHKEELTNILSFLSQHRIQYGLNLSPLAVGTWYFSFPKDDVDFLDKSRNYYEQVNDTRFLQLLNNGYSKFPAAGDLLVELKLEIMLRNKSDAAVFGQLLKHFPKLKKLLLELVDYTDEGVQAISRYHISPRITTFGIKVHTGPGDRPDFQNKLDQSSYNHLFDLFPTLEFLQFMWPPGNSVDSILAHKTKCFKAISTPSPSHSGSFRCPKLRGIHGDQVVLEGDCQALTSIPRPLELIDVHIYQQNNSTVRCIEEMCSRQASCLRLFNLIWNPDKQKDLLSQKIQLPECWPHLETLGFTYMKNPEIDMDSFSLEMVDVFSLRRLFLNDNLGTVMPALTKLQLLISFYVDEGIWEHFFPDTDEHGIPLKIREIINLSISLTAECDSPQIARLIQIFPNLTTFQHTLRTAEDNCEGCEHQLRGNKLVQRRPLKYWSYTDIKYEVIRELFHNLGSILKL